MKIYFRHLLSVLFIGFPLLSAHAGKVTVILEDNLVQQGGKIVPGTPPPYSGDPELKNSFSTLQTRLQTMLVSSGRVNVKPRQSIDRALDGKIYVCSYTLVQGRKTGVVRGPRQEYILGINLQGWNYADDTPLAELSRTVDIKLLEESPENAFKFVTRYLAFITLAAIAPVEIVEKDGSDVRVNAGGEILQVGDILTIRKGLRMAGKIRVVETEPMTSICEIVDGDVDAIGVGARCTLQLPDAMDGDKRGDYVPTVEIDKITVSLVEARSTTLIAQTQETIPKDIVEGVVAPGNRLKGIIGAVGSFLPKQYVIVEGPIEFRNDVRDAPTLISTAIRGQDLGMKVLSIEGMSEKERRERGLYPDYLLKVELVGYSERHDNGQIIGNNLVCNQIGELIVLVTLQKNDTREPVGGRSHKVVVEHHRQGVICPGMVSANALLPINELMNTAAAQVASQVRSLASSIRK